MLWIILLLSVASFVYGFIKDRDCDNGFAVGGTILGILTFIAIIPTLISYNATKTTSQAKLEVLEQQNQIVLDQVSPIVQKYMDYETQTFQELKPNDIVALANVYPELMSNQFVSEQLRVIVKNQEEIKELKLDVAGLNAYRLWLFTPKEVIKRD